MDWPLTLLYDPEGQGWHAAKDVLPVDGLYVPDGQAVHEYGNAQLG